MRPKQYIITDHPKEMGRSELQIQRALLLCKYTKSWTPALKGNRNSLGGPKGACQSPSVEQEGLLVRQPRCSLTVEGWKRNPAQVSLDGTDRGVGAGNETSLSSGMKNTVPVAMVSMESKPALP